MGRFKRFIWFILFSATAVMLFACSRPKIGITNGRFVPCPASPNCVSSQAVDKAHQVAPLVYNGSEEAAHSVLLSVLRSMPRCRVIANTDTYIHATFTSKIFRFVDDVEFYFNKRAKTIQIRSASRVGYSDLGVNRKRVDKIRRLFEQKIMVH